MFWKGRACSRFLFLLMSRTHPPNSWQGILILGRRASLSIHRHWRRLIFEITSSAPASSRRASFQTLWKTVIQSMHRSHWRWLIKYQLCHWGINRNWSMGHRIYFWSGCFCQCIIWYRICRQEGNSNWSGDHRISFRSSDVCKCIEWY